MPQFAQVDGQTIGWNLSPAESWLHRMIGMTVAEARTHWATRHYAAGNLTAPDAVSESAVVRGTRLLTRLGNPGPCSYFFESPVVELAVDNGLTGYEYFTWDAGEEFAANVYPGGTAQMFDQNTADAPNGAEATLYQGHMGLAAGDGNSADIAATAGTTYRFTGYSRPGGDSYPFTDHGRANYDLQVNWYNAGGSKIQADFLAAYADVDGGWRPFGPLAFEAPVGAVKFRIGQNEGGAVAAPNATGIDQVTIQTVGSGVTELIYGDPPERLLTCDEHAGLYGYPRVLPADIEVVG